MTDPKLFLLEQKIQRLEVLLRQIRPVLFQHETLLQNISASDETDYEFDLEKIRGLYKRVDKEVG
jgi:hypothetical protein